MTPWQQILSCNRRPVGGWRSDRGRRPIPPHLTHDAATQPLARRLKGMRRTELFTSDFRNQPYWWDRAAPTPIGGAIPPRAVDVAIVGTGFTGLSAARILLRAGRSVALLDGEDPGFGASRRNAGYLGRTLKKSFPDLMATHGREHALAVYRELDAAYADRARDHRRGSDRMPRGAMRPLHRGNLAGALRAPGAGVRGHAPAPRFRVPHAVAGRAAHGDGDRPLLRRRRDPGPWRVASGPLPQGTPRMRARRRRHRLRANGGAPHRPRAWPDATRHRRRTDHGARRDRGHERLHAPPLPLARAPAHSVHRLHGGDGEAAAETLLAGRCCRTGER